MAILGAATPSAITGRLRLQLLTGRLQRELAKDGVRFDDLYRFVPSKLGPVAEALDEDLSELASLGFVDERRSDSAPPELKLTAKGQAFLRKVLQDKDLDSKHRLREMALKADELYRRTRALPTEELAKA